jgi:hypothetical protein
MKRYAPYLYALVAILVTTGAGFYFHTRPIAIQDFSFSAPCSKPIPYTIGTIDPRFHLTQEQVAEKLSNAADLWNTASGKVVLTYAPEDPKAMPVNFVYDSRQQTVALGQNIDATEASQNAARLELETLQKKYALAQQSYAAAVADFNAASAAYSKEVKRINASGGADQATYDRLQAEQTKLKQQQANLKVQGDALAQQGAELDSRVQAFNANVHQINQVVEAFNSNTAGDFEEGQYVRDTTGKQHIDIYAYKDEAELLHSLAHEFGHALGLGHNENTESIMFPYNKSGTTLSEDDVAALKAACRL